MFRLILDTPWMRELSVAEQRCQAPSTTIMAHLRELAPRKEMLTLLIATKDIDISEAAVLAKLVLS